MKICPDCVRIVDEACGKRNILCRNRFRSFFGSLLCGTRAPNAKQVNIAMALMRVSRAYNLHKESNMSNEIIGTEAQAKELDAALEELKKVPGPVMKAMQKAQEIYGYLPIEIQSKIAKTFGVSLEEVYGIATFYAQFNLQAKGKYTIGICLGTACYVKGSGDVLLKFKERLGIDAGQTTPDRKYTLDATRCIGCCGLAPVLAVNGEVYGNLKTDDVDAILAKYAE